MSVLKARLRFRVVAALVAWGGVLNVMSQWNLVELGYSESWMGVFGAGLFALEFGCIAVLGRGILYERSNRVFTKKVS